MSPLLISLAVFAGVAALVGGVAFMLRGDSAGHVEDRLDKLAGKKSAAKSDDSIIKEGALAKLSGGPGAIERMFARFGDLALFFEQADTSLTPAKFALFSAGAAVVGAVLGLVSGALPVLIPVFAVLMAFVPSIWLVMRRKRRFKKFAAQLPDGLELISRALRAGHSLGSGMSLVAEEMPAPIGPEFGRTFEEQNLGVSLDDSLNAMTARMPNLDLKFFATAVILQRQTGGDLAEILDKIGYIIRERFKIWGQVQALTGEGRLSGIVLLALPPVLFLTVYYLNPDYMQLLFTDPMGKQMLAGAILLQFVGALVIKKIITIKV